MDMYANNNRQASNTYHYSPENAEINIDSIAVAVAKLNYKILQLRKEIVAFKNENKSHLIATQNTSRSTPSGFNDSTKNEERRTDARYELQRNFKGNDSPGGTDLSARLSFAKRVREVKAASEAAVFKEDYPRDDKSIEDDERPNRSRVFELSGTYQKSISDVEKFGKEVDKRSDRDVRNLEDVKTSCFVDEKLRKPNKYQNKVVSNIHRNSSPRNASTKIKKKRISRGVQYDIPIVRQTRLCVSQFFLNCFRLKSNVKKCNLMQKIEKEESSDDKEKFDVGLQNDMNESLGTIRFNHKSQDIEMEDLMNNIDIKKEKFENDEDKITNTNDNEKQKENDNLKNCKVKINFLEKLSKVLNRNNNLKEQQDELQDDFNIVDDSQNNKKEIDKPRFENKRMNDDRRREELRSRWDVKIFDRKKGSNNACKTATMNSDKESDVNKVKKRLDLCIVELNDIINDACVIFGSGKNSTIISD
ncbi:myb-like protein X isoform X1 [Linepithema humile]|uniref:myb-like protein X isoform X1 n=1 Tax=Linepithema humile TaxID=83485 RepID=UPI00351EE4E1